tara:strand:- start:5436 stop:6002 length:567 start_codon:yes stop_codon:yes gene_type:complete
MGKKPKWEQKACFINSARQGEEKMDEAKAELTLEERAVMLRDKVSFHNKKAGWKKTYREKFNVLVKAESAKVDKLKKKRNDKNKVAKVFKENRDEATIHYRHAKLNNNITVMNQALREQNAFHEKMMSASEDANRYHEQMKERSLEVMRLMKKADKCHQKMKKAKSKADAYHQEYMEVMREIERGEEE